MKTLTTEQLEKRLKESFANVNLRPSSIEEIKKAKHARTVTVLTANACEFAVVVFTNDEAWLDENNSKENENAVWKRAAVCQNKFQDTFRF